jgi:hypothetical protein
MSDPTGQPTSQPSLQPSGQPSGQPSSLTQVPTQATNVLSAPPTYLRSQTKLVFQIDGFNTHNCTTLCWRAMEDTLSKTLVVPVEEMEYDGKIDEIDPNKAQRRSLTSQEGTRRIKIIMALDITVADAGSNSFGNKAVTKTELDTELLFRMEQAAFASNPNFIDKFMEKLDELNYDTSSGHSTEEYNKNNDFRDVYLDNGFQILDTIDIVAGVPTQAPTDLVIQIANPRPNEEMMTNIILGGSGIVALLLLLFLLQYIRGRRKIHNRRKASSLFRQATRLASKEEKECDALSAHREQNNSKIAPQPVSAEPIKDNEWHDEDPSLRLTAVAP